MSGRYEVRNRYSAYIEARRNYLEQSESEEDLEVRTILRRPQTYLKRSVSTSSSSEEQPQSTPPVAMVLVPTVTIQEVTKEVEIKLEEAEPIPSSSVQIQEIEVLTPNEDEVKTETEEPCALCTKVGSYIRPYYENLKTKTQKLVDRVMDPSLHATIKSEFFEYLPYVLLAFAIFFFAITFVSFVKLLSHGVHNEPSFFCRYFSGPFSPMFDALCAPEPFVFSDELPRVMSGLIDEIMLTIAEFFRTIGKGFTVFGTLFTAIYHGLSENVFFGFHELGENLGENINHLIHFIVQFFQQIIHLFFSAIATVAGAIAGIFTSLHDYFEPKPVVW